MIKQTSDTDFNKLQEIPRDKKFLESVFERIPGMIYVHDLVKDVNLYRSWSLKKILGYPESEFLNSGKGIRGLVHKEDVKEFKRAARELPKVVDNECVRFVYRMVHKNGQWLWFQSEEYVYARDSEGKPTAVLGYVTDLTDNVEQQELLKQWNRSNEFLLQTARILVNSEDEYKGTLDELVKAISLHFDVVCDISILDEQTQVIVPESVYHSNPEVVRILHQIFNSRELKKGEGLVGSVIAKGEEILINDVPEKMRVSPRSVDSRIAPQAMIYRPLKGSTRTLGSLNLTRLEGQKSFSDSEIEQIRQLANHVSLFVENALLHEERKKEVERRKRTEHRLEGVTRILEKGEEDTLNMLNTIPIYIGRVSKDLRFTFLNNTFKNAGINPRSLEGKYLEDVLGESHVATLNPYFEQVLKGDTVTYEYDGVTKDGVHRYFNISMAPDFAPNGEIIGFFVSASDMTSKIAAVRKLEESEERLRLIFNNVEDYISIINEDGVFESINRTSQGHSIDDVLGLCVFDFYDKELEIERRARFEELKKTGESFQFEEPYVGPDGTTLWYLVKYMGIFRKKVFYKAIVITRDITAEKSNERIVMNAMLEGQEQERKRLGAELHDGIGQILSAISLDVSQIRTEAVPKEECNISNELQNLNKKVQTAIKEVRNISHDLMPQVLESFGLKEAINQLCSNLHDRSGTEVKFDHVDVDLRYNQTIEVNLYRITQELLNNIHKHASCKNVFISLMDHGDLISLTVEDDGIGFNPKKSFKGIGLRNIYSRVSTIGGQIDLESAEKSGTLVNIEVPKTQS